MSTPPTRPNFVDRHLDPASRLSEILFGLIMVLQATLTAGLTAKAGEAGVRQLLHAAIGCNIAWGLIDAVMYVMNCITIRSGKWSRFRAVQTAADAESAIELIRQEIEPGLELVSGPEERDALYRSILHHVLHGVRRRTRITMEDLLGAVACFILVSVSCLPAALPFLIFSDPPLALRASNCLLIAMLFFLGYKWAQYVNANRLVAGLAMVAIGLGLVGVAVLLGG